MHFKLHIEPGEEQEVRQENYKKRKEKMGVEEERRRKKKRKLIEIFNCKILTTASPRFPYLLASSSVSYARYRPTQHMNKYLNFGRERKWRI